MNVVETLRRALADRYRLERELGQGGMATVYLATDLRHQRSVALKVLRPELAVALGGERFLREIRTTAQLTHPHILPLLDSGEAEGTLFYVMPYVEGESLRDRLERERQLPLDDAVRIAREVADALSFAHSHGVIHRDIKPENILLEAGHAVVADFGIARALSAAGGERLTETGLAVGTPTYMSPEQAMGARELDGRSDLYSLGCVLYEMLGGEPPYTGPTPQSIVAKKLSAPAPQISVVRDSVPASVEAALLKVLARVAADRFPTAADFAAALAHPETLERRAEAWPGVRPLRVTRRVRWAVVLAVLGAIAFAVVQSVRARPLNVALSDIRPVTNEPGVEFQPATSPDGNEVAYLAGPIQAPHLVIRSTASVAGGGEVRLQDTLFGTMGVPRFRSDGQAVRFGGCRAGRCGWWETGKLGGAVQAITAPRGREHAWSPDGSRVAFSRWDTLFVASATDTAVRRLAVTDVVLGPLNGLAWSPDGRRIAYVNGNILWQSSLNVMPTAIWVVDAEGGTPRRVTSDRCQNESPAWLDARHLLYVSTCDGPRGVYVVEVGKNGARGTPRAVPGTSDAHTVAYSAAARRLVFSKLVLRQNIWAYPLGARAPVSIRDGRPVTTGVQAIETHDVSPDGRWIVYSSNLRGNFDIFKVASTGGVGVPLTDDPATEDSPKWSPDGREVAFSRYGFFDSAGTSAMVGRLMTVPAEGGTPTPVTPRWSDWDRFTWAPSGLAIGIMKKAQLWMLRRDSVGAVWREAFRVTDFPCAPPKWVPDGSGVSCPAPGAALVVVSPEGKIVARRESSAWAPLRQRFVQTLAYSRDGQAIYLLGSHSDGRDGIWAFPVTSRGAPRLVVHFDERLLTIPPISFYAGETMSVGPDQLYLTVSQYESDIWTAKVTW